MPGAHAQKLIRPDTSFGPFRFVDAVPWLMVALACRIISADGSQLLLWLLGLCGTSIAVLLAFMAVARRVFEMFDRPAYLHDQSLDQEVQLSLRIFGCLAIVTIGATLLTAVLGQASIASYFLLGLDGMAFNGPTVFGRIWSAVVAAMVLLLVLGVDRDSGKISVASTLRGAIHHGVRFGAAVVVLVAVYVALGSVQGWVRNEIWGFWPIAAAGQYTKNLIYFMFTLGFAVARLWATVLILTYGLKQSTIRAAA
jgi:hypothetical protein